MNRHVWVNSDRLKSGEKTLDVDGIELFVRVSPYSIPKKVVGRYDPNTGEFRIEFKYIDNEQPSPKPSKWGEITIREGRYSRKIISITVPMRAPEFQKVGWIGLKTKITGGFKERALGAHNRIFPKSPDLLNQEVAEEILDENLRYLASGIN